MPKLRIAGFMSGSGTNLEQIIELQKKTGLFEVVLIFSDTKDKSVCNAEKIAEKHEIPLIVNDIKEFYAKKGADRKDMKAREEFDMSILKELRKHNINLVALCGYMSIVTRHIYSNFITLNVHPADLTRIDNSGERLYAGCAGESCIKKAFMQGDKEVKSTVHLVNGEVDGGPVIAVSAPVLIRNDFSACLDELKRKGDWIIYPEIIRMFAEGKIKIKNDRIFVSGVEDVIRF